MKTEKIFKKVIPSGNAGGVYVPKRWINQYVVVSLFSIEEYVLNVLTPFMKDIKGVYLYGSHARRDACPDSDMNVFVLCDKDIPYQRMPGLSIEVFSLDKMEELARDKPVDYYCMVNEAVPLLDTGLLKKLKCFTLDREKIDKFYGEVRSGLKMTDDLVSDGDYAAAIYSFVLRLRGLCVAEKAPEKYSRKGFEKYLIGKGVTKEGFRRFYDIYRAKRDDRFVKTPVSFADVKCLRDITERILKEAEGIYPQTG